MEIANLFIAFIVVLFSCFFLVKATKDRNRNRKNRY